MFAIGVLMLMIGYMLMYAGVADKPFFGLFTLKGAYTAGGQAAQPAAGPHRQASRKQAA